MIVLPREMIVALHLNQGQEALGHVLSKLLKELPSPDPENMIEKAQFLDNFYIPARYSQRPSQGAPFEHYGRLQSEEAITHARSIFEFVRSQMAQ